MISAESSDWDDYVKAVQNEAKERGELESKAATFTCSIPPKSNPKPTSVHKLQPGDIDIIAAIGDSLTVNKNILIQQIIIKKTSL